MLERLGTRARILILVLASALPMIVLATYVAVETLLHEPMPGALLYALAAGAITLLLVLVAWHGAERFVLAPIRRMVETTRRVGAGDLSARTGIRATGEELSELGAALDSMAAQLESRDRELRIALRNLTREAMTDSLTGLYNRRFFWDALAREVAASRRDGRPFSVILLDIDRFKRVNDTWGHDAGDEVLRSVAEVIEQSIRDSDIAVRHGGEEFAVLLPNTTLEVAAQRAETIRRALEAHAVRCGDDEVRITASFGVAQHGACTPDPPALMKAVDAAMYSAKAAGRNRVVLSELVPEQAIAAPDAPTLTAPPPGA